MRERARAITGRNMCRSEIREARPSRRRWRIERPHPSDREGAGLRREKQEDESEEDLGNAEEQRRDETAELVRPPSPEKSPCDADRDRDEPGEERGGPGEQQRVEPALPQERAYRDAVGEGESPLAPSDGPDPVAVPYREALIEPVA